MSKCQIFTAAQIDDLRKGGAILRACLEYVATLVRPGISTSDIDAEAEAFIRERGGLPAFKGYHGFPATLCTSINEECVHGIPSDRLLRDGDIVSLDGGVLYAGLYTDACVTVPVGTVSEEAQQLLSVTKNALDAACAIVAPGVKIGDISSTIQKTVEAGGYHCVRALTGHGLGDTLHQFPDVPNVGQAGTGPALPVHTIIAIEPITSVGSDRIVEAEDGWTIRTADGALSAHFEHTVLVTEKGKEIIA